MLDSSYVRPTPGRLMPAQDVGSVLPASPEPSTENESDLVLDHIGFAEAIARRYTRSVGDPRDIRQVALLGLVKAARRFDPERGFPFTAFAGPTIAGEIKRYLRDTAWAVRPPRGIQELSMAIGPVAAELEQRMGREPTRDEIAEHMARDVCDVAEAISGGRGMFATALDDVVDSHASVVADWADPAQLVENEVDLQRALQRLPRRDRAILYLRFYEGRNQREISAALGMSQMQVSRAIAKALRYLRALLATPQAEASLQDSA